jgi:MPBQ/MSBQ methyltransferase
MSNKYVLECKNEANRLEKQSALKNYSLVTEFKNVVLPSFGKFLDAGCGSGVACNFINEILPQIEMYGCDLSDNRIEFAKKNAPKTNFFKADITKLSTSEINYDCIINRYVAHHLTMETYKTVLSEFKKCLRPNGKLII